jgi:hypothetical protein
VGTRGRDRQHLNQTVVGTVVASLGAVVGHRANGHPMYLGRVVTAVHSRLIRGTPAPLTEASALNQFTIHWASAVFAVHPGAAPPATGPVKSCSRRAASCRTPSL